MIAAIANDGIIFMSEKIIESDLYELSSKQTCYSIMDKVGIAFTGIWADGLNITNKTFKEMQKNKSEYGFVLNADDLIDKVAMQVYANTLSGAVRPYGSEILLGSFENEVPALYHLHLDGSFEVFFCLKKFLIFIFLYFNKLNL